MMYYSDRAQAPLPPLGEEITPAAWTAICATIELRIEQRVFALYLSLPNEEKEYTSFTKKLFYLAAQTKISDITWPLMSFPSPSTLAILDLVEFCHEHIYRPGEAQLHNYDPDISLLASLDSRYAAQLIEQSSILRTTAEQIAYREDINRIFVRNGLAYKLDDDGRIIRTGTEVLQAILKSSSFQTGDARLDTLLEDARTKYLSNDPRIRREAVEKLWDAWERLKTIEPGKDKKASVTALLDKGTSEPVFRQLLEEESNKLTSVGNEFEIRHSEIGKVPLNEDEQLDYLFQRMFAIIRLLLKRSGRGG